jgi:hypothetical protein
VVSLVDKEAMRSKLSGIADKLKIWTKSQEVLQAAAATETAKAAAVNALAANKVIFLLIASCVSTTHFPLMYV